MEQISERHTSTKSLKRRAYNLLSFSNTSREETTNAHTSNKFRESCEPSNRVKTKRINRRITAGKAAHSVSSEMNIL